MNVKNSFLVAASVLVLGSCAKHSGETVRRGTLFNNESHADSEGFEFFKSVHEKAQFEVALAKYIQSSPASAEAKGLADKIATTYGSLATELEDLSGSFAVILPAPGEVDFVVPGDFQADSLGTFDNAGYIAHVQHEQGAILNQFNRLSRNTNSELKKFAEEKIPAVKELFAAAGGQEDHSAHH